MKEAGATVCFGARRPEQNEETLEFLRGLGVPEASVLSDPREEVVARQMADAIVLRASPGDSGVPCLSVPTAAAFHSSFARAPPPPAVRLSAPPGREYLLDAVVVFMLANVKL